MGEDGLQVSIDDLKQVLQDCGLVGLEFVEHIRQDLIISRAVRVDSIQRNAISDGKRF